MDAEKVEWLRAEVARLRAENNKLHAENVEYLNNWIAANFRATDNVIKLVLAQATRRSRSQR